MSVKGICRVKLPDPLPDEVVVRDIGDNEWRISEMEYEAREYSPPLSELPWQNGIDHVERP